MSDIAHPDIERVRVNLEHRRERLAYAERLGYPGHISRCKARVEALEALYKRLTE